ncbi:MAG TPA: alpha amylase C-terminal domain-containing protein, partial [Bryobacteraceae bacterium]|nr:alpha amylase C-terminal domain-containing protein [Bryobacteraceae bacterium]
QTLVRELNRLYTSEPALYEIDYHWSGFEWVDFHDVDHSIIAFLRRADDPNDTLLFCCNFTPVPHHNYRFGVPSAGFYKEIFNSDAEMFGGSNMGNRGGVPSLPVPAHGKDNSIAITLPPLAVVVFKKQ